MAYKRYTGLKGDYWTLFSEYIRRRDWLKYGTCICCEKVIEEWKFADAGHYVAAGNGGFGLLFDEQNVNLQCKRCNNPKWSPDASIPYGINLDKRYGKGTAKKLWARKYKTTKAWSDLEYEKEIEVLKAKLHYLTNISSTR